MDRANCRTRCLGQTHRALGRNAKGTSKVFRASLADQTMHKPTRFEVMHLIPMIVITRYIAAAPADALPGLTKMEDMKRRKEERKRRLHEAAGQTKAEASGRPKDRKRSGGMPSQEKKGLEEGVFADPSYTLPEDNVHRRHGQNEMFQG